MAPEPALLTDRLILRQWKDADLPLFAAVNADPEAMAFFPALLDRAATEAQISRWSGEIAARGWGFWAVERREDGAFLGTVGLQVPKAPVPVDAGVEVGWRLALPFWGFGYASEAARACLEFGFKRLELPEIVSFTARINERSWRVMERLGMHRSPEPFEHPAVPEGSPLRTHVLYRLLRDDWEATTGKPGSAQTSSEPRSR